MSEKNSGNDLVRANVRAIMDEIFRLHVELGDRYSQPEDLEAAEVVRSIETRLNRASAEQGVT